MLHVFLVDIGIMLKFDTEMVAGSVGQLMESIQQQIFVPPNKQVLLSAHGEPLKPENRVASYVSSGTENSPIFLFSRTTFESPVPPSPSINFGSESSLKEDLEKCVRMKPSYDTLVARTKLAMEYQRVGVEFGENCENLVKDQILQHAGWLSALENLDHIRSAFENHVNMIEQYYQNFQKVKLQYEEMLQRFNFVLVRLKQLPLLSCLCAGDIEQPTSLLQWISNHDQQSSLENLVQQCTNALKQCNTTKVEGIFGEARRVLDSAHNVGMTEIKGLSERLINLQKYVLLTKQLVQDQTDMAKGFKQNQIRAQNLGDPSILPDLCASHQKQLHVLMKNHYQIRDNRRTCAKSKDELSANLHTRLRWVMQVEKSIWECDSKLLVYFESIKRIKKRLDIFEQIYEAPRMYVLAVLEVIRRKNFSGQFTKWSKTISESAISTRTEEIIKRETFKKVFGNHFVKNLFPGLDQMPQPFAEDLPEPCDGTLPDISADDVRLIQQHAPELMSELNFNDPLETSVIVRDCLSQSNLTKLIDPKQNKTLEETMNLRQQVSIENDQLTMSVLKREMSLNTVEPFPLIDTDQFETNTTEDNEDSEFEPASLGSLSQNKQLITSSDSEALFHSAELEFSYSQENLSPISGKSSSSPITIQSSKSFSSKDDYLSRSFSPHLVHPLKENVLSLPDIHQNSEGMLTHLKTDVYSSSLNSSRSLSDAIKSSETNRRILDSPHIVKNLKNNVVELKTHLHDNKNEILQFQNTLSNLLIAMTTDLVNIIHAKFQDYQQNCPTCASLQLQLKNVQENTTNKLLEENNQLLEERDKQQILVDTLHNASDELVRNLDQGYTELSESSCPNNKWRSIQDNFDKIQFELQNKRKECNHLFSEKNVLLARIDELVVRTDSLTTEKDKLQEGSNHLQNEVSTVTLEIQKLRQENGLLQEQLEKVNEDYQKSNDLHLEQVSSLNVQTKGVKKLLTKAEEELTSLKQEKEILESQKQTNFNTVFNKIKKEKDQLIRDMTSKIATYEKEMSSMKCKNDTLLSEISMHKEGYMSLEVELKKFRTQVKTLETQLSQHKTQNVELVETNKKLLIEVKELQENEEDLKKEKLKVLQELKTQYDEELRKEKASLALVFELERQSLEEYGKSDHAVLVSKSGSIEEGVDELELDKLLEKVKKLEAENEKFKKGSEATSALASTDSPKLQRVVRTADVFPTDKVCFKELDIGNLVFICYDDTIHQYIVLSIHSERYFLHADCHKTLSTALGKGSNKRQWFFGHIIDKEYCLAKKPNNKFALPVNTYFSRIHVQPCFPSD